MDGLRREHYQRVERRKYRGKYRGDYDARDYRMEFLHDERRKGELGVCDRRKHEAAGEAEQSAARGLDEHPRYAEDGGL